MKLTMPLKKVIIMRILLRTPAVTRAVKEMHQQYNEMFICGDDGPLLPTTQAAVLEFANYNIGELLELPDYVQESYILSDEIDSQDLDMPWYDDDLHTVEPEYTSVDCLSVDYNPSTFVQLACSFNEEITTAATDLVEALYDELRSKDLTGLSIDAANVINDNLVEVVLSDYTSTIDSRDKIQPTTLWN